VLSAFQAIKKKSEHSSDIAQQNHRAHTKTSRIFVKLSNKSSSDYYDNNQSLRIPVDSNISFDLANVQPGDIYEQEADRVAEHVMGYKLRRIAGMCELCHTHIADNRL
jgi:hypothetical protein